MDTVSASDDGATMSPEAKPTGNMRVLIVEDELMIRMLLEGMLEDIGHSVAGQAGDIDEALVLAKKAEFDVALLDVNLNGKPITPVVDILVARGLPFVFASGYGQRGVPDAFGKSPVLQKPFQVETLAVALQTACAAAVAAKAG